MMNKQTSDERLLKLIEGTGDSDRQGRSTTSGAKKVSEHPIIAKLNFLELKSKFKALKINLFALNRGLIGLAILLTVMFLYILISGLIVSGVKVITYSPSDFSSVIKLISSVDAQGLMRKNIFNQDIRRNFFLPFGSKSEIDSQEAEPNMSEEIKTLKLVGIIWSQNPEVMIENSKDFRTYTLKKGESLNDQFKIKDISRSSVTIEINTPAGLKDYELR